MPWSFSSSRCWEFESQQSGRGYATQWYGPRRRTGAFRRFARWHARLEGVWGVRSYLCRWQILRATPQPMTPPSQTTAAKASYLWGTAWNPIPWIITIPWIMPVPRQDVDDFLATLDKTHTLKQHISATTRFRGDFLASNIIYTTNKRVSSTSLVKRTRYIAIKSCRFRGAWLHNPWNGDNPRDGDLPFKVHQLRSLLLL